MRTKLFAATQGGGRGAVLVTHGLNNKPEAMDALIRQLTSSGFHCVRVALSQHARAERRSPDEIARRWVSDLADAYAEVRDRFADGPVLSLGYSLGALVTIRLLQIAPDVTVDRMVLLAPPVRLTTGAALVRLVAPLAALGIGIPSLAPKEVRARPGTPVAEYGALLRLSEEVREWDGSDRLARLPTRVFLDEQDEMVDFAGVIEWIERRRLTSWAVHPVGVRTAARATYRHLMISEASLGRPLWTQVTVAIVEHFRAAGLEP